MQANQLIWGNSSFQPPHSHITLPAINWPRPKSLRSSSILVQDLERTGKVDLSHQHQKTKKKSLNTELIRQQQNSGFSQNRSCFQKAATKPNTTSSLSTSFKELLFLPLIYFSFKYPWLRIGSLVLLLWRSPAAAQQKPCINYNQEISLNKSTKTSSLLYSSQVTQCMSCTAIMQNISTYPHSPLQSNAQTGLCKTSLPQPAYVQPSITQLLHWKKPIFSVTNCPRGLCLTTEPDMPHTNEELPKSRDTRDTFHCKGKLQLTEVKVVLLRVPVHLKLSSLLQ